MASSSTSSPYPNTVSVHAPGWDLSRPHLTGDFLLDPAPVSAPPLSSFATNVQHSIATQDAISALIGVRAAYADVTSDETGIPTFSVAHDRVQRAHPHVVPFLSRILPLASHHAAVRSFVESSRIAHSAGHVRQALSSAMFDLLIDYHAFVIRLETAARRDDLTLQKLLYFIQPTSRSMALLAAVSAAAASRRGGAAFDAVHALAATFVGSPDEKAVLAFLLGRAAAPLLDTLAIWLSSGVIDDPHGEFFIAHDSSYRGTALDHRTWEMRFTVNSANVPLLLQPFVERILRAGKYLSVLHDCDVDIQAALRDAERTFSPGELPPLPPPSYSENDPDLRGLSISDADDSRYHFDRFHLSGTTLLGPDASRRLAAGVDRAFKLASASLMTYLVQTVRIRDRLRCLKRFFLLEQGDYLVHFLDAASAQLTRPRHQVSRSRLTSLLELSVRSSAAGADAFLDDLSIELVERHLAAEIASLATIHSDSQRISANTVSSRPITGFEAISLTYNLNWPIKLIVSSMDITKYQFLFRYLFYSKHVERQLEECWRFQSQTKRPLRSQPASFVRSFALRNRMLQFIRSILYYTFADVIEPGWSVLDSQLRVSNTIDDIMTHHASFLGLCSMQSLLSNERHQTVFKNICETCLAFAAYTAQYDGLLGSKESREILEESLRDRNYPTTLAKFETSFDMHFGNLLDGVSTLAKTRANVHLINLCERLDSGGYYSNIRERSLASLGAVNM